MNSSISRQLVFWLAMPLTLLALCGVLVHYFNNLAPQMISTDHRLKERAGAIAARLEAGEPASQLAGAADGGMSFAVRDAGQQLLGGDAGLPAQSAQQGPVYTTLAQDRHSVRVLTTRIATPAGAVDLSVADELKTDPSAARYGFMSTLLWDFVQLDLTLVLVWFGIQLGLRPLKRLRDEIAERSPLDLRPIPQSTVPRELAPLAATVNRLFTMLSTATRSQQQFIANTAHQLRTPLTGMLAQLDLLLAEPQAEPLKTRLVSLQEGLKQLAHASNQLLSLARADPAINVAVKKQLVDLAALAGDTVGKYVDRAVLSNIDLGAELGAARVLADPSLLDDLIGNLVDNALKYTPAGGRVTVTTGQSEGAAFLKVEDDGPGIPPSERERVRQRYYRLPNSPGHGSGLGLAIVDEIARLFDGKLSIESAQEQRGTRVIVRFAEAAPGP